MRKNTQAKITEKQNAILALENRITADNERLSILKKELDEMEALEIMGLIKELCISTSDVKSYLEQIKKESVSIKLGEPEGGSQT